MFPKNKFFKKSLKKRVARVADRIFQQKIKMTGLPFSYISIGFIGRSGKY